MYLCISLPEIKNKYIGKALIWISNVSLGVYIIHAHPFVLDDVLTGKMLSWAVFGNPVLTVVVTIGIVLAVVFATGILEQLRMILFKACHIDSVIKKFGYKLDKILVVEQK